MADLIDREEFHKYLNDYFCEMKELNGEECRFAAFVISVIDDELMNMPTVESKEVIHARWQGVSPMVDSVECSNCRYELFSAELQTPFCPWCGAEMDEVE